MSKVTIEVTIDQAEAISKALETYSRLCIGQLEHIAELCRYETIPVGGRGSEQPRAAANVDVCNDIDTLLRQAKVRLGYSFNGSNGIGHTHVDVTAHRAWEVGKVLSKALAEHHNPNPKFRGVNYNGRIVHYTSDPDAAVRIGPGP